MKHQNQHKHIAKKADRKQSPEEMLAALAEEDSQSDSPVDSESDDEDLLQPERRRDSHHDVPPSESDEEYESKMASAPPSHPQPSSSSSGSESPKDTQSKGKASSNPMKRVCRSPRGGSPRGGSPRGGSPRGGSPRGGSPALRCMPMYYGEDGTQSRRYCRRCRDAGSKRVKTPVYCSKCQVPLCLTANKNCFTEWHLNPHIQDV
ncbi:clumping factor A-like isoform X2 [Trematomus bernacchii]|uniref:clumping factor A-like isoform X2 n=1 Tax=Trematomus bernacchii TaxID=40690 RepID=UPI00146F0CD4|nr:clumping factor A-like isoform X2 [Trematomus bernacchii]